MQNDAARLIGKMIQFAAAIYNSEGFAELNRSIAIEVSELLSHCLTRVSETYPIWLYTMHKVCVVIVHSIVKQNHVSFCIKHIII